MKHPLRDFRGIIISTTSVPTEHKLGHRKRKEGIAGHFPLLPRSDKDCPSRERHLSHDRRPSREPASTRKIIQPSGNMGQDSDKRKRMIEDIWRIKEELRRVPAAKDLHQHSEFSRDSYYDVFGTWKYALALAGLSPRSGGQGTEQEVVSDEQLLDEVRRLKEDLGRAPTSLDMKNHGKWAKSTCYRRFGNWQNVIEEAGFEYTQHHDIPLRELINEMLRVAEIVDRPPFQEDMREHGKFSVDPYKRNFGTWGEALEFSGLPARKKVALASEYNDDTYYGRNWKEQREYALSRDGFTCQHCGLDYTESKQKHGRGLCVHHIIPIREFEEPEEANFSMNLITLCDDCHRMWEEIGRAEFGRGVQV